MLDSRETLMKLQAVKVVYEMEGLEPPPLYFKLRNLIEKKFMSDIKKRKKSLDKTLVC